MIHRTKVFVRALGVVLGLLLVAGWSWAADPYPTRTIRWVVPWPAGGVADTQARIIADQLGKALGQQVMIDNRAGASGVLGADAVAKSRPDGYTLLYMSPNEQAIAQAIGLEVGYDAAKDFTPITQYLRTADLEAKCAEYGANTAEARAGELLLGMGVSIVLTMHFNVSTVIT